jgi:hypothetical protein
LRGDRFKEVEGGAIWVIKDWSFGWRLGEERAR